MLGADTKKIRTTDSVKLIEYTFSNFQNIDIKTKIEEEFNNWNKINSGRINIKKGIKNVIELKLEEYDIKEYPVKNNTEDRIKIQIEANLNLIAPVKENMKIGEIAILYEENIILKIGILTNEEVRKKE